MNLMNNNTILIYAIIGGGIGLVAAIIMMLAMKKRGGKVPRFSQIVNYSGDTIQMMPRLDKLLTEQGYSPCDYNNEEGVYQKGIGALVAKQFIKILPQEGGILVEGFISVYGTESGLIGFTGMIPKKACQKVVNQLISLIQNG